MLRFSGSEEGEDDSRFERSFAKTRPLSSSGREEKTEFGLVEENKEVGNQVGEDEDFVSVDEEPDDEMPQPRLFNKVDEEDYDSALQIMTRARDELDELLAKAQQAATETPSSSPTEARTCTDLSELLLCFEKPVEFELDSSDVDANIRSEFPRKIVVINGEERFYVENLQGITKYVMREILKNVGVLSKSEEQSATCLTKSLEQDLLTSCSCETLALNILQQQFLERLPNEISATPMKKSSNNTIELDVDVGFARAFGSFGVRIIVRVREEFRLIDELTLGVKLEILNTLKRIANAEPPQVKLAFERVEEPADTVPETSSEDEDLDTGQFMKRELPRMRVRADERYACQVHLTQLDEAEQQSIPLYPVLELSRISKVSCGLQHCGALSDIGMVFTWGNGADGALGHGDREHVSAPRLVAALSAQDDPILAVDISVGSDLAGSHTCCVSREGIVFSWGVGGAIGHGDAISRDFPKPISIEKFDGAKVYKVECGGGFSIALTCMGKVFSWGLWQHGRLGLGKPELRMHPNSTAGNVKAVARFRTSPKEVAFPTKATILDISCGDSHCLAVDAEDNLYSWGRGSFGQLGTGRLHNSIVPRRISHLLTADGILQQLPCVSKVGCGGNLSFAVLRHGAQLVSWGGLGSANLGQGASQTNWHTRVKSNFSMDDVRLRKPSNRKDEKAIHHLQWKNLEPTPDVTLAQPWRWPRVVESLKDVRVEMVSAGRSHCSALDTTGIAYCWGKALKSALPKALPFSLANYTEGIVSGGALKPLSITSGARAAEDFRRVLHESPSKFQVLQPDVILVVETETFLAHRVILAARSTIFRKMLEVDEANSPTTLELDDLSADATSILLDYIYGDNLFQILDLEGTLADEVFRTATDFEIGRLRAICAKSQGATVMSEQEEETISEKSTFADDFRRIINDPEFSNVRIVCELDGKTVFANKFILAARSQYFLEIFSQNEEVEQIRQSTSQGVMLWVVAYLYSGNLEEIIGAKSEELLECIANAHKIGIQPLQRLCEDALVLRRENAIRTLLLGYDISSSNLITKALDFLAENLAEISFEKSFVKLQQTRPMVLEDVFRKVSGRTRFQSIVSKESLVNGFDADDPSIDEGETKLNKEDDTVYEAGPFPWQASLGLAAMALQCILVMRDASMLQYVPFANFIALASAGVLLFKTLAN